MISFSKVGIFLLNSKVERTNIQIKIVQSSRLTRKAFMRKYKRKYNILNNRTMQRVIKPKLPRIGVIKPLTNDIDRALVQRQPILYLRGVVIWCTHMHVSPSINLRKLQRDIMTPWINIFPMLFQQLQQSAPYLQFPCYQA